jgi:hypothetical protein
MPSTLPTTPFYGNIATINNCTTVNATVNANLLNANSLSNVHMSSSIELRVCDDYSNVLFEVDKKNKSLNLSKDTDIKLGNVSIRTFLERIEQRLEILHINPELESEWDELKELGDRYRQLEKELLEKNKVWDILKKT